MADTLPTADDVIDLAPELASADPARIGRFITRAANRCSASFFGTLYTDAVALLAAHMLTVAADAGGSGPVSNKSADGLSIGYSVLPWSAAWYNSTAYGREWRGLVKSKAAGLGTLAGSGCSPCAGDIVCE